MIETLFGDAVWVGSSHPFDLHEVYLNFYSPPIVGKSGESAELLLSADSRYRLWLNGALMGRGPSRCYPEAQSADRIDLTANWQSGENQIIVQVYQPGYSHFSYVHRAAAGLLATLRVNGQIKTVTNSQWHVQQDRSFSANVPRISIYGSGIEVRDLNLQPYGSSTDIDQESLQSARVVADINGPIWSGLRKRDTPKAIEQSHAFKLIESRSSKQTFNPEIRPDQVHGWLKQAWEQGVPQSITLTAEQESLHVESEQNQTTMWLLDLGRAYTCQGWADIEGASGHETLLISYGDKFKDGELVISDPTTYCRVRPTDQFTLRPGSQTAETFSMRGGRYVLFAISGVRSADLILDLHVRTAEYPLKVTKPLNTDHPKLNQIIDLCENTFKACLQDSFTDCVWRESSQWLGDGLIQSKILAAMSDDYSLIRKLLHDTAAGQDEVGFIPSVAPGELHAYNIPRYACMWIECLAFYLRETDDQAILNSLISDAFLKLTDYLLVKAPQNSEGLYLNPAGRRHYIDWSPTSQSDPHCVANLHIAFALQEAAWVSGLLEPSLTARCLERADQLIERCRHHFFKNQTWFDDLEHTTYSQLAAALALIVGASQQDERSSLLEAIISRSLDLSDEHETGNIVLASPFMHHYIFEALAQMGQDEAIIDIILARWGRWADQGCATTWENWNIDFPDGSACHAYSAHPRYHLARIYQANSATPILTQTNTVPYGERNTL